MKRFEDAALECADMSALLDEATCRLIQKRRLAAALQMGWAGPTTPWVTGWKPVTPSGAPPVQRF